MSKELKLTTYFTYSKSGAKISKNLANQTDVAGDDFTNARFDITPAGVEVTSSLATIGFAWVHNLDPANPILGGSDGVNFPLKWLPGEAYPIRLQDNELHLKSVSIAQVETFDTTSVAAADLDGTYLPFSDSAGTVGFWIDTDDSGTTIPGGASALDRAVEITTLVTGDSDTVIATKIAAAINADSEYSASSDGTIVTVTQAVAGDVLDASAGDTGFTSFNVVTNGETPTVAVDACLFPE